MKDLIVFGAGGHAKVVIDIVEKQGTHRILGILDDLKQIWGGRVFGYPVLGGRNHPTPEGCQVIVAIGANQARRDVAQSFRARGTCVVSAVHPSAQLGRGASLGSGTVVMAVAAVNSDSVIGEDVIINTGATVDHDCCIGNAVHVAPGVTICGGVTIQDRALIGAGATVIPGVEIGADAIIGAGACVVTNVSKAATVAGVPAKPRAGSR